jgi:hypothetical protein
MVEGIVIDLLSRLAVYDDETNTRRWCNWATVLIAKTAHSRAYGLLLHIKTVFQACDFFDLGECWWLVFGLVVLVVGRRF